MNSSVHYSRRGGAKVGAMRGTWPFGKIAISQGAVTVSVTCKSRTLRVAEVLRIEPLGFFSTDEGPGVRIFFRGKHWEEYVDFYSLSARAEVLAELGRAGFKVVEQPGS